MQAASALRLTNHFHIDLKLLFEPKQFFLPFKPKYQKNCFSVSPISLFSHIQKSCLSPEFHLTKQFKIQQN